MHYQNSEQEEIDLFVHGIHRNATENDIIRCFRPITKIYKVKFITKLDTGKHKGYAFFKVKGKKTAELLIKKRHYLLGRWINCDYKINNKLEEIKNKQKRIFIGGLPWKISVNRIF